MPRSPRFWKILVALIFAATSSTFSALAASRSGIATNPATPNAPAKCSRPVTGCPIPQIPRHWRIEKPPFNGYWKTPDGRHCPLVGDQFAAKPPGRFPSTVAVLLTALLLALVVRRFTGDRRALWTVFIFCTSILTIASAKFCITDAVMMFFVDHRPGLPRFPLLGIPSQQKTRHLGRPHLLDFPRAGRPHQRPPGPRHALRSLCSSS